MSAIYTEVINQKKSRVISSSTSIQSDLFFQPQETHVLFCSSNCFYNFCDCLGVNVILVQKARYGHIL